MSLSLFAADIAQSDKLRASDPEAVDLLGWSVDVSGDAVVVGSIGDDDNGDSSGSAYLFEKNAQGVYEQSAKLSASDGLAGDNFGYSVAIDGDTIVIGAYANDTNGTNAGAVYIFEKPFATSSVHETQKLTALDAEMGEYFGISVDIDGDAIAVGAYGDDDNGSVSGAVYLFERNASSGSFEQVAKLHARDGVASNYFGYDVAIDADIVAVGAYRNWSQSAYGAAYLFEKGITGWADATQVAKLGATDQGLSDAFASRIAIDSDTVAVGAYKAAGALSDSGAVYLYAKPESGWVDANESAKLTASDDNVSRTFGKDVAISGDNVLVGMPYYQVSTGLGKGYLFTKPSGEWVDANENVQLVASDVADGDLFGFAVALDGTSAVIGSYGDDDNASGAGAAYRFELSALHVNPAVIMYLLN